MAYGVQQICKSNPNIGGILISLIDEPLVSTLHYSAMRARFKKGKNQIIVSESDPGWVGVSVLFDAYYSDQLKSLSGEKGVKVILKKMR